MSKVRRTFPFLVKYLRTKNRSNRSGKRWRKILAFVSIVLMLCNLSGCDRAENVIDDESQSGSIDHGENSQTAAEEDQLAQDDRAKEDLSLITNTADEETANPLELETVYKKSKVTTYNADGEITRTHYFSYDVNGTLLSESFYQKDGSLSSRTNYRYDEDGNKLSEDSVLYHKNHNIYGLVENTYDSKGNTLTTIDRRYYENGMMESYSEFSDVGDNMVASEIIEYDETGKITYQIKVELEFGTDGKVARQNVLSGSNLLNWTEYTNEANRKVGRRYLEDGNLIDWEEWVYDDKGNTLSDTVYRYDDTIEKRQEWSYDDNGDVLIQSNYDYDEGGGYMLHEWNADGVLFNEQSYDRDGVMITAWKRTYDLDGNIVTEETYDNGEYALTKWIYDSDGNKVGIKVYGNDNKMISWSKYEYKFDSAGRKLNCTYRNGNDSYITDEWRYDENGNMIYSATYNQDGSPQLVTECTFGPDGSKTNASFKSYLDDFCWQEFVYDEDLPVVERRYNEDGSLFFMDEYEYVTFQLPVEKGKK